MSDWKYHVSIWQNTVAPEDPTAVAQGVEEWMNKLAADGWEILNVQTHAMINNIFRAVLFCRKSADLIAAEAKAAAEKEAAEKEKAPAPNPEPDPPAAHEEEDDTPTRGKRHR